MIAAIIIERNLQNVANYLVASLAVADLMVACLVMPLGAVYEVSPQDLTPSPVTSRRQLQVALLTQYNKNNSRTKPLI